MVKLVELPWGDYVNPEHVVGVTVEDEGELFVIHILTDVEGLHIVSDGQTTWSKTKPLLRDVVERLTYSTGDADGRPDE